MALLLRSPLGLTAAGLWSGVGGLLLRGRVRGGFFGALLGSGFLRRCLVRGMTGVGRSRVAGRAVGRTLRARATSRGLLARRRWTRGRARRPTSLTPAHAPAEQVPLFLFLYLDDLDGGDPPVFLVIVLVVILRTVPEVVASVLSDRPASVLFIIVVVGGPSPPPPP